MHPAPIFAVPSVPEPPRRGSLPLAAAVVPVMGAAVMWLVTGSPLVLWFAALGPAMAVASLLDGRRAHRQDRRRRAAEHDRLVDDVRGRIREAHARERAEAQARHPDVAAFAAAPAEIWRRVPGRAGCVVVGRGALRSSVRVDGEGDSADALRREAHSVGDAPVVVPAGAGIAVVGPEPLAGAVVRGLALQLLCQSPPNERGLATPVPAWGEGCAASGGDVVRLAPPFAPGDLVVTAVPTGTPPPPVCAAVLTLTGPDRAVLDHDGLVREVRVEAVAQAQARSVAETLTRRGDGLALGRGLPDEAWRAALPAPRGGGLAAVVGVGVDGPYELDLVAHGPHAVVAGMTGAGKSELLVTWIAAIASAHETDEVTFLLIDFKGGTAFRRLSPVPHVTDVLTDLDEQATRRAVEALRAEIRRREAELAETGATDIDHPAARLPRLVVVVDEFAALLQRAPELATVFTDVAARGRGLGIHLVLGTQRVTGVVREAILANCPLRIGLRLADTADSRHLLGSVDAAEERERGVAHVRTAAGAAAVARIARTDDDDIARLAATASFSTPPRAVCLPPLPSRLPVEQAPAAGSGIVLGLADEPERQRQSAVVLAPHDTGLAVVGGAASGRSALLAGIAAQDPHAVAVPRAPEAAWDALSSLLDSPPVPGTLLLCDDLDLLLTRVPPDYAAALVDRVVELARGWGVRPVVTCGRATGLHARIVDQCSRRAHLRMPTRLDHVGAGLDPATHDPSAPRGRGTIEGMAVQFVEGSPAAAPEPPGVPHWRPGPGLSIVVLPGAAAAGRVSAALAAAGAEVGGPTDSRERGTGPRVLLADADGWQRAWSQFTALRGEADLVVAAECAPDYRMLTGDRALPPYCEPGRGRGWLLSEGRPARRILLPVSAERRLRAVG